MQFFLLGSEEACRCAGDRLLRGAMGLGQFMPSSYREYAVDLDSDGRRDLWVRCRT
jgi:membrane-bound lytic murein transglycosylase B